MLRFDTATFFLPFYKSILSVKLSNKMCGLEVLLFPEFINIVSIYICIDLILLLYTF